MIDTDTGPIDQRHPTIEAIATAFKECGVAQLWHWNSPPAVVLGQPLNASDLDLTPQDPTWSRLGTLTGYWLAPGKRRKIPEVELFRKGIKSLPEIKGRITATPIQCAICIGGKTEPFFGEVWTIHFPKLPAVKEELPQGLDDRFIQRDLMRQKNRKEDQGTRAILANQRALELRNRPDAGGSGEGILNEMYAEHAQAESERLISVGDRGVIYGAGEKLAPVSDAEWSLANTLDDPNMISVGAAGDRLQLARQAGVLKSAVDAACTAGANNTLEKMLAHQMALAHRGVMKMGEQSLNPKLPNVEANRCANSAARYMQAFQSGMLTLQKIKTGGKQTVIVKHIQMVQVGEGGQAVVAGQVNGKGGVQAKKIGEEAENA